MEVESQLLPEGEYTFENAVNIIKNVDEKRCLISRKNMHHDYLYIPNPSARAGYDTR